MQNQCLVLDAAGELGSGSAGLVALGGSVLGVEVCDVETRDLTKHSPHEHLVVLVFVFFFNSLSRVQVTQNGMQKA